MANSTLSFGAKVGLTVLVTALCSGAGAYAYQQYRIDDIAREADDQLKELEQQVADLEATTAADTTSAPTTSDEDTDDTASTDSSDNACATALSSTGTQFDLLGGESFTEDVCGYLVAIEQVQFDETYTVAYLRLLTDGSDGQFTTAVEETIAEGNTVNQTAAAGTDLRIACLDTDQELTTDLSDDAVIYSQQAKTAIEQSTGESPVALRLTFSANEGGTGIVCDSLADQIDLLN